MARTIDLNADLGESFGSWRMGQDEILLELVTSANIACGFHAGDPDVMADTVRLAVSRGVALGAHPSLPDRQGFGRRPMALHPDEIRNLVLYQIGALAAFARAAGARLVHVKPHGALYSQAASDPAMAEAVAAAVRAFDANLILVGPAGSHLVRAGEAVGLAVAREGFADRRYEPDGTLTPRSRPDALIEEPAEAVAQVLSMVERSEVTARDGTVIPMPVDTLCLHGDSPDAAGFARRLRMELATRGIGVAALDGWLPDAAARQPV
ncbi:MULTISPECIES: 5-oxoprolinase subunit PxpA [Methylococcus]|uniref:5-oxoprolinase subunit A n=1 Tax=Methylococcus capsulatus TaxID=414 RepID=A0ABZ2F551_METCP|nr:MULTISPECIES: 5-oxoprolinase subunit PxpA [Methylococcus]MDF9393640.1 LamB/YcsF family protein [Methylococcus capsulatus]